MRELRMSPSATPATHKTAASQTSRDQARDQVPKVPRLPHKVKVDVTKCHACHTKTAASWRTSRDQARHQSHKCHACHTK